jgi:DNA-binding GntR family transcriptional regulator
MAQQRADSSESRRPEKASLKEEVYDGIRQDIMEGTFLPGDLLKERELAEKHGVSKTPVREALSMLEQDNLVRTIPRAGYMVTGLTLRDLQEICQLRIILEPMAARLAMRNLTDEEIEELARVSSASDPAEARLFNRQFHSAIARASGNSRLAKMIEQLVDQSDRWAALDDTRLDPAVLLRGHQAELEALRTRDPDVVEQALRAHIQLLYDHLSALYPQSVSSEERGQRRSRSS